MYGNPRTRLLGILGSQPRTLRSVKEHDRVSVNTCIHVLISGESSAAGIDRATLPCRCASQAFRLFPTVRSFSYGTGILVLPRWKSPTLQENEAFIRIFRASIRERAPLSHRATAHASCVRSCVYLATRCVSLIRAARRRVASQRSHAVRASTLIGSDRLFAFRLCDAPRPRRACNSFCIVTFCVYSFCNILFTVLYCYILIIFYFMFFSLNKSTIVIIIKRYHFILPCLSALPQIGRAHV